MTECQSKRIRKGAALILWLFLTMAFMPTAYAVSDALLEQKTAAACAYLLETVPQPEVSSVGGEWCVLGLARANRGTAAYFDAYRRALRQKLRQTDGNLHRYKYTEYARVTLALTALGENPADFAGFDVLTPLTDTNKVLYQGTAGAVWALTALDSRAYPDGGARQTYLAEIRKAARADGAWALGEVPDADLTAMALNALLPYAHTDAALQEIIDKALAYLSRCQNADGSYSSGGRANAESTAQVVVTLSAYSIPETDARFVKNGKTALEALLSFQCENGGFRHTASENADAMATEQAFYALAAVRRARDGKGALWNLCDASENQAATAGVGQSARGLDGKAAQVKPCQVTAFGKDFADIAENPSRRSILSLAARGILNGKGENTFDPDGPVTRAEFCAMVVRALGLEPVGQTVFTDVSDKDCFFASVGTAYTYAIVNGVSETSFDPNGTITREQACGMLFRAARLCGLNTVLEEAAERDALALYTDYRQIGDWARQAAAFCAESGIFVPLSAEFYPQKAMTRAETADGLFALLNLADLL